MAGFSEAQIELGTTLMPMIQDCLPAGSDRAAAEGTLAISATSRTSSNVAIRPAASTVKLKIITIDTAVKFSVLNAL